MLEFVREFRERSIGDKIFFPVWLRNRLISTGLEQVLSHTKKCIASYYRKCSKNIKIKILKLIPILFARAFGIFIEFKYT